MTPRNFANFENIMQVESDVKTAGTKLEQGLDRVAVSEQSWNRVGTKLKQTSQRVELWPRVSTFAASAFQSKVVSSQLCSNGRHLCSKALGARRIFVPQDLFGKKGVIFAVAHTGFRPHLMRYFTSAADKKLSGSTSSDGERPGATARALSSFVALGDRFPPVPCVKPPQSSSGRVVRPCRASPRPCAPLCVRPRGGCAGHPLGRSVPSGLRVLRLSAPCPLAYAALRLCAP